MKTMTSATLKGFEIKFPPELGRSYKEFPIRPPQSMIDVLAAIVLPHCL